MIYTVKTVVGRENIVIDSITSKVKSGQLNITALLHPEEIKGYVFVEGDVKDVEKALQMVPHIRGLIKKPVEMNQIQRFLQPKTVEIELAVGDVVEVIGGPFKGEKGKSYSLRQTKREITMELIEVTVPIPITVSVEFIKLIEKASK